MNIRPASAVLIAILQTSLSGSTSDVEPVASVTADNEPTNPWDQIRVRIFPHKRNFPPHYRDSVMHRFKIISDEACTVFDAHPKTHKKSSSAVVRAKTINFDASRLRGTVWVECTAPFQLLRENSSLPSYTYVGPLQIKPVLWRGKQTLQAVMHLPVEKYLQGVVPAEVMASWPMEALKSQAVAARTYAVFHMNYARKHNRHPDFDVDDTVVFQAYTGVNGEHPRTDLAVEQTAGEILMFGDEVIQAYYHADSGGVTASAAHVFKMKVPYCQTKKEAYRPGLSRSGWQVKLSVAEINDKLTQVGFISSTNPIAAILPESIRRTPSGRVQGMDVRLQNGNVEHLDIAKWKRAIALNSSLFDVTKVPEAPVPTILFTGKGAGHGVGLNQTGAKILADHYAWTYDRILKFYYSDIKMCSIANMANEGDAAQPACEGLTES